jgi:excisionase family DNA binding protein
LLLTVVEAAEVLSVGRSTVYELIYAKQLPSVKIGNCRRIKRSDLETYVRDLCEPS